MLARALIAIQQFDGEFEEAAHIGVHGKIGTDGRLGQLRRIDIHLDLEGVAGEGLPVVADLAHVQAATEDEQHVGVLYGKVAGAVADGAGAAAVERMVGREEVVGGPGGGDGDSEFADESAEEVFGARDTNAATRHEDGAAGFANAVQGFFHEAAQFGGVKLFAIFRLRRSR